MKSILRLVSPTRVLRLVSAALLALTGHVALASNAAGTLYGEVLVKLRSTQALAPLLAKYPLGVMAQFGARPIYRLKSTSTATPDQLVAALALEPDVLIAEPNITNASPEARKNAVWAIGTAAAYAVQWAPQAMRLAQAQGISRGTGVRVAVLDTGVERTHPALAGRLLAGHDFVDDDNDPSEEGSEADAAFGHGTHVAGLVALTAPDAKIMPLRVLDPGGSGNSWVLAEAILYAVDPDGNPATDDGAHIINLSLGTTTRTRIFDAVAQLATCTLDSDPVNDTSDPGYDDDAARCAIKRSVVIVAAAGNDGSGSALEYPAAESAPGLAAVGASASNARLAGFSNYASWVRFAAPGDGITSSVPGGGYGTWSGTSMAAPLFAGVAALVRAANPTMKADDILRRIGARSGTLCGTNLRQIDAYAALRDQNPPSVSCK